MYIDDYRMVQRYVVGKIFFKLYDLCNINQRNKVKYQNKAPKRVQDQATVNYISFALESGASGAYFRHIAWDKK